MKFLFKLCDFLKWAAFLQNLLSFRTCLILSERFYKLYPIYICFLLDKVVKHGHFEERTHAMSKTKFTDKYGTARDITAEQSVDRAVLC
jgi:hypothetical protein